MSEQKQRQYEGQKAVAEKGGLVALLTKLDTEGTLAGNYVTSISVASNTVTKG